MKWLIVLVLATIVFNLFKALRMLIKESGTGSVKMVRALTWRISLSIGLMVLLALSYYMGWVVPNPILI